MVTQQSQDTHFFQDENESVVSEMPTLHPYEEGDGELDGEEQPPLEQLKDPDWFVQRLSKNPTVDEVTAILGKIQYNDPVLYKLLNTWEKEGCGGKFLDKQKQLHPYFHAALLGVVSKHPHSVLTRYTGIKVEEIQPPRQRKKHQMEFDVPSELFDHMAKDCLMVMELFLKSCEYMGCSPDRWLWDFILCSLMDDLKESGEYVSSPNRDAFAKLVCLVLSGNTKDETCIRMTMELAKNGLLNIQEMAEAKEEDLERIIKPGGYHKKRARFLKQMAIKIQNEHDGKVPNNLVELMQFEGVARKTAVLALNEALGQFVGIGTDIHVIETVKSFNMIEMADPKQNVNAIHAEAALRTWVPKHMFPVINKIFGSFSQMFTQNIPARSNSLGDEELDYMRSVCKAAANIRELYHVSLLFCMIHSTRRRYRYKNIGADA